MHDMEFVLGEVRQAHRELRLRGQQQGPRLHAPEEHADSGAIDPRPDHPHCAETGMQGQVQSAESNIPFYCDNQCIDNSDIPAVPSARLIQL